VSTVVALMVARHPACRRRAERPRRGAANPAVAVLVVAGRSASSTAADAARLKVYKEVCSACHALSYIAFRISR